jgi:lipid II:glycine glycyltransferase (peptidoglycan interpeptide bridge formation enzyme)
MILVEVRSKELWEAFVAVQPNAQFQQSWAWGEFNVSQGIPVKRFAFIDEGGAWKAAIQLVYRKRRFGFGYWFAARGPVFNEETVNGERTTEIIKELSDKLFEQPDLRKNTIFWRIEPFVNEGARMPSSLIRVSRMSPPCTFVLDLAPTEEELLKAMHEKTRYNIRVAERNGIRVRTSTSDEDLAAVLDLMDETARRDRFTQLPREHVRKSFTHLAANGMARAVLAEQEGKLLAGMIEIEYGDTTTYLHGASSSSSRNLMAPFAMHWEAIKEAKRRDSALYDFWGANPKFEQAFYYQKSWVGFTVFKERWGGRRVCFSGTYDRPTVHIFWYRLLFFKRFFRR